MVSLMTDPSAYLIIDAGGTFLKSAILDKEGGVYENSSLMIKACSEGSKEEILRVLRVIVVKGLAYIRNNKLTLCGVAMDFPGPFDYFNGFSMMEHKFKNIRGVNLREFIYGIPGVLPTLPVVFKHDANSALVGELWKGHAQGFQNAAIITLGTGLGFSFSDKGVVQCNALGGPLVSIFKLPYKDGILEDYVSKRGFLKIYRGKNGKDENGIDVADLAKRADSGDAMAMETFREVGKIIAENIQPILEERHIECLLFGGQISRSFRYLEKSLNDGLQLVGCLKNISAVKSIDCAPLLGLLKSIRDFELPLSV